jgi:hypothetical protein
MKLLRKVTADKIGLDKEGIKNEQVHFVMVTVPFRHYPGNLFYEAYSSKVGSDTMLQTGM